MVMKDTKEQQPKRFSNNSIFMHDFKFCQNIKLVAVCGQLKGLENIYNFSALFQSQTSRIVNVRMIPN